MGVGVALLLIVGVLPASAYPRPGVTERVSVASDGTQSDHQSWEPAISADGRFVAFESWATNLVPGKTTFHGDVYVHDRATGATQLVSVATDGTQGNARSREPSISADGRYVAFESRASTLVPGDTNGTWDVFVHDRGTGVTERVSVASDGTEADDTSAQPSTSADGRYVAFESWANNLAPEAEGGRDIFVRDRETGQTTQVSVASDGTDGNGQSRDPAISADGRHVTFDSNATNLVPGITNTYRDVFVRDLDKGQTERVSVSSTGAQGLGESHSPSISADGRYVAFRSAASQLVPGDSIDYIGVFVRDREAGTTEKVSVTTEGARANGNAEAPSISADGQLVAFQSWATNLTPGEATGGAAIFVRDRATSTTERVSVTAGGAQANDWSYGPAISADARHVAFMSLATDLVPADTNEARDVFVRDRGPVTGIGSISAALQGDAVTVSGWARLAGAVVSEAADPEGDALPGASELGADLTGASITYRPEEGDLLVRIRVSSIPAAPPASVQGPGLLAQRTVLYGLRMTVGGADYEVRVRRRHTATNPLDVPASFTLHRCELTCTQQAELAGGIATTGPEALVSAPLSTLGISEGASLTGLRAFTAIGNESTGGLVSLDEADLPAGAVPVAQVRLGIAPAGSNENDVDFATVADLTDGAFSGAADRASLLAGQFEAWARACVRMVCGAARTPITLD